jgi:hypothetical protein
MAPRAKQIDEWISLAARLVGLLGLVAFAVEWFVTKRIEPLLVASAGGLYGLGKGGEALAILRHSPPAPQPPAPETTSDTDRPDGPR